MLKPNVALRIIGLTRKSKGEDEGTHADQRKIISDRCEREGFTLIRVDSEKGISGTKKWREREVGRAVEDIKAGKADGIIVAFEDRISRESMAETAAMWDEFRAVGLTFIACDGVDSRQDGANLTFAIKAAIARDKIEVTAKRSNMGRARVVAEGVHGGDDPPYGYVWTERTDGTKNLSGNAKHGPLDIDSEKAPVAVEVFERRAAGAARRELIRMTGLSEGAVMSMLRNPVYTGVAYSGKYVNNNGIGEGLLEGEPCKPTHPALVSMELFDRVQRTFGKKRPSKVVGRDNSLLSRVLACGSCGRSLVLDRSTGVYRCKDDRCERQVTITADRIEPFVFHRALSWHAVLNVMYEIEQAEGLPEVTKGLAKAYDEREEIEQAEGLTALRRAQALTEVDGRIAHLEQVLAEVEAVNGWLGMNTDAVMKRLVADGPVEVKEGKPRACRVCSGNGSLPPMPEGESPAPSDECPYCKGTGKERIDMPAPQCSDLRAGNEFCREMVKVVVNPVGRGRKVPVADRVEVNCLTPSSATVATPAGVGAAS